MAEQRLATAALFSALEGVTLPIALALLGIAIYILGTAGMPEARLFWELTTLLDHFPLFLILSSVSGATCPMLLDRSKSGAALCIAASALLYFYVTLRIVLAGGAAPVTAGVFAMFCALDAMKLVALLSGWDALEAPSGRVKDMLTLIVTATHLGVCVITTYVLALLALTIGLQAFVLIPLVVFPAVTAVRAWDEKGDQLAWAIIETIAAMVLAIGSPYIAPYALPYLLFIAPMSLLPLFLSVLLRIGIE